MITFRLLTFRLPLCPQLWYVSGKAYLCSLFYGLYVSGW